MRPELEVRCPKCGAPPGMSCRSVKGTRGNDDPNRVFRASPYEFHKKRRMAVVLGAPSTESLTVPVRLRTLKRRARVGAVDSALKSLKTG